jgi:hypothetical protein
MCDRKEADMSTIPRRFITSAAVILLVATSAIASASAACVVVGWHEEAEGMYPIFRCG